MTAMSALAGRFWSLPRASHRVSVRRGIRIPMRDGTALAADLYAADGTGHPSVLIRSPYGRGAVFGLAARLFAERGYRAIVQSCRGTADSGGTLDPFFQEKADGLDTVDWIEAQPWYDGRLATYGPSYLGNAQWAMAAELGDRLSAMAVAISLSDFREELRSGGGFTLDGTLGWVHQMANMKRMAGPGGLLRRLVGGGRFPRGALDHLPLGALDRLATGETLAFWQAWLDHDPQDGFWTPLDHRAGIGAITAPVSMIAGWSDIFLPSQLRDFMALRSAGRDARIMIGPWTHIGAMGTQWPVRDALDWFDHHLKGKPLARRERVRYLLEGGGGSKGRGEREDGGGREGGWHEAGDWPVEGIVPIAFHLAAHGRLVPSAPPPSGAADSFVYDPADPTPSVGGPRLAGGKGHDAMTRLAGRADVLRYVGAPLDGPCDLVGPVVAEVTVQSDRPDHDLFVCLCEIGRDGIPMHITDGYVRLSAMAGKAAAWRRDAARTVRIECWPIARRLAAGSRPCLLIAAGAHPRYARNNGTGEPIATATRLQTVRIAIRHDGTRLTLPLMPSP